MCIPPAGTQAFRFRGSKKLFSGPCVGALDCQNFTEASKVKGCSEFQPRREAFRGSSLSVQVFVC